MTLPSVTTDKALRIYTTLVQYPILGAQIRQRMRRALFDSGVVTPQAFEAAVREQAIRSQEREALHDPLAEEPAEVWDTRLRLIREHLTEIYFAYNLSYEQFEAILRQTLAERGADSQDLLASSNPPCSNTPRRSKNCLPMSAKNWMPACVRSR